MKLKELLKVVPDNYLIGLMDSDPDNYSTLVFGNKKDVLFGFGQRAFMPPAHVENLPVVSIHPGATARLPDKTDMYGEDSVELHVRTQLLIEVNMYEEESK